MAEPNTVAFPRKLLKNFIQLYKEQPCLWDKDCVSYKIKKKRHEAVTKLIKLVQEFDPSVTRVHVLRKIESLRACVRREFKKVTESKRTARSEDEVYVPHLWYYPLLSCIFTDEGESNTSLKLKEQSPDRNLDSEGDEDGDYEEEHSFESSMEHSYQEYNTNNIIDVPETSNKRYSNFEEEKSKRHCTEIEDEYDAIGINVAAKLRNLPSTTRILAEKLINDVLFQAQTNALTSTTTIMTPDPFK